MNIAFPVLLLTLVLLPGFLFRYAMLRGTYRRSPVTAQQVAADLGWLTLFSAALHTGVGLLAAYAGVIRRGSLELSGTFRWSNPAPCAG
ncbi:hypothetical protein [Deinococcus sp. NW-56]|uniref:hypothetical protein n=1 Tax=Deinococcus sp. NW-56 TaxID=2080419 RepID=UPI000CF3890A|nr:hypothetical protein [Deinococcus sp. NW-56]